MQRIKSIDELEIGDVINLYWPKSVDCGFYVVVAFEEIIYVKVDRYFAFNWNRFYGGYIDNNVIKVFKVSC